LAIWLAAKGLSRIARPVRQTLMRNMEDLLQPRDSRQIRRYVHAYFFNLAMTLYEILIDSYSLHRSKDWRFQIEGEEHLTEALRHGKGAVIFTPHTGNFFYYYWYLSQHYPCLTVATVGSKELQPLYKKFEGMGCQGLDYDATPPLEMIKKIRKHLAGNGVVFLLGDFWRPTFPIARFFGRTTRSPGGPAMLSLDHKAPIVPFYGYRTTGFRHRLVFGQPVWLHEEFERNQVTDATSSLNLFLEQVVRLIPEQWFYWFNVNERWEPEANQNEAGVGEARDGNRPGGATVA
jgi:KDO2-lipid IV(A) lauroyltransferase